jgi:hypothetical protein
MARTRAAGDNRAYRDASYRDGSSSRPGTPPPRRAPDGWDGGGRPAQPDKGAGRRHVLGIFAVSAVFALVGLTLWRPLAIVVALPVIVVLALVIRVAVPVPPPARPATTGPTGSRTRATGPLPRVPAPERGRPARPPASSRYSDRPPYDQEANQPRPTGGPRRAAREAYRAPGGYEPGATEVLRPGHPPSRRPGRPAGAAPPVHGQPRAADAAPPAWRRDAGRGPGLPDERSAAAADRRDQAAGRPPAQPRRRGADYDGGYDDREYGPEHDREYGHEYDREPGGEGYGGHDGHGRRAGETTRWWRRPSNWDDEPVEPEPEPDDATMHTMAIDLRGYLDDTGSFRMP